MPSFIVKPQSDVDYYVLWSSIIDGPILHGNNMKMQNAGIDADRLGRADAYGTSAHFPGTGA